MRAVVVALLVEGSLLTPEVRSSNPVIGEFLNRTLVNLLSTVIEKIKRQGMAHFYNFVKMRCASKL